MPVVNYIWDVVTDNVIMEVDDEGYTLARYVQEPSLYGAVISQERDSQTRYYNFDGLGNTAELTDENDNVTDTYEYSAFGEEIAHTGSTVNPFRYKGALGYYTNSETKDIYVRERPYQPTIGRWLSLDALGFLDGPNPYIYVDNSGPNFDDPSGLLHVETRNAPDDLLKCNDQPPTVVWWFHLDSKIRYKGKDTTGAPCAGYVVQRVSVSCYIEKCTCVRDCTVPDDEKKFDKFEYWELFPVTLGQQHVPDTAFIPAFGKYCTKYTQTGELRFYCARRFKGVDGIGVGLEKKWKPGRFGVKGGNPLCSTSSGTLAATSNPEDVKFWNDNNKPPVEGPATRSYDLVGDCCNGNDNVELTVKPPKA
jgi:RHS repeat-associated protein